MFKKNLIYTYMIKIYKNITVKNSEFFMSSKKRYEALESGNNNKLI
jgi:hypothetical protein